MANLITKTYPKMNKTMAVILIYVFYSRFFFYHRYILILIFASYRSFIHRPIPPQHTYWHKKIGQKSIRVTLFQHTIEWLFARTWEGRTKTITNRIFFSLIQNKMCMLFQHKNIYNINMDNPNVRKQSINRKTKWAETIKCTAVE